MTNPVLAAGYVVVPIGFEGQLERLDCIVTAAEAGEDIGWYVLRIRTPDKAHYGCQDRLQKLEETLMDVVSGNRDGFTILRENGIVFLPRISKKHKQKKNL